MTARCRVSTKTARYRVRIWSPDMPYYSTTVEIDVDGDADIGTIQGAAELAAWERGTHPSQRSGMRVPGFALRIRHQAERIAALLTLEQRRRVRRLQVRSAQ